MTQAHSETSTGNRDREAQLRQMIVDHYSVLYANVLPLVQMREGPLSANQIQERAEEILSEAISRALGRAKDLDLSRSIVPWLMGIAVNVLRERRRRRIRDPQRRQTDIGDEAWEAALAQLCTEPGWLDEDEHLLMLRKALSTLDAATRRILTLRFTMGLDGEQLAAALGAASSGAARVRVCRALQALREAFHAVAKELSL